MPSRVTGPAAIRWKLDQERFIATWQASASVREVADKLNITIGSASSRASRYRRLGHDLKVMPKGPILRVASLSAELPILPPIRLAPEDYARLTARPYDSLSERVRQVLRLGLTAEEAFGPQEPPKVEPEDLIERLFDE